MPMKRRTDKARRLDAYRAEQLIDGPEAALLAGTGYQRCKWWRDMDAAERADVLAEMRRDWEAHRAELIDLAGGRAPWAQTEFEGASE